MKRADGLLEQDRRLWPHRAALTVSPSLAQDRQRLEAAQGSSSRSNRESHLTASRERAML